ncbi:MAG: tetratricopeptide repeat protein [Chitinophagales bacterium]|nr:tetratricopeptide repeat protein [Chitinophagales bacterium]MDW8419177.1 tetratricopeptide repeat protein [Chitinophagales bacterium]
MRYLFFVTASAVLVIFMAGCSTTNHAVFPVQAYHDLTSHYNAYFNAREKFKATIKTVEANHKDKFDSVIAVYAHNDLAETTPYASDLEDVIRRSTQSIQLHNFANWSDDNMLLIGKANYLKGDYDKASASFKYITTEYKEGVDYVKVQRALGKKVGKYVRSKKKKKKPQFETKLDSLGNKVLVKKDNRPEKSIWWHTPARSEALIWLIKTYTRQQKFDDAASVVMYVRSDDNFYKDYDPQLELAAADVEVSRKNYAAATEPLEKYLQFKKIKKKKRLRVRPLFVLAQCYEATGNFSKAADAYRRVLKSRPNYDMEFYAKLRLAKLGRSNAGGSNDIKKLLARMSRDGKYKDYWDQVYYELALIALRENQRDVARNYLRKSIAYSTTNEDQKANAYLKLAQMDDEEELYVSAKYFYDTTLTHLARNDTRYAAVEERNKLLGSLVEQLKIIAHEDSIQRLAKLPETERRRIIQNILAKKEEEAQSRKNEEERNQQEKMMQSILENTPQQQTQTQSGAASNWYFYNTAARANGYNEFIRRWGRRKLEENWRRKNKSSVTTEEAEITQNSSTADTTDAKKNTEEAVNTPRTPEEQLEAGIPLTQEKLDKSNARLAEAYYNAGVIYKDGLEAYQKAKEMFETLNNRLAPHKLQLESYYQLYLLGQLMKNPSLSETYKNKILSEFPESVIAKILKDPNYIHATKQKEREVNQYYELAYNDYHANQLDSAWLKCKMSDALYAPNPLSAKFELLLALVLARQNKLEEYVQLLQKLSNKSTDYEVKKTATELLNLLNKSSLPQIDLSKDAAARDSLNALHKPQPDLLQMNQQLNEIKEQAKKAGVDVKTDTITQANNKPAEDTNKQEITKTAKPDTTNATTQSPAVTEDTTSPYVRSDAVAHYFILFTNHPEVTPAIITSAVAKINAYNSTVYEKMRLQTKQVKVDSKTTIITVRQFPNAADALSYFKSIKTQSQLFDDFKAGQYSIACISATNFSTLLSQRDMDAYLKFFNRVYK